MVPKQNLEEHRIWLVERRFTTVFHKLTAISQVGMHQQQILVPRGPEATDLINE